MAPALRFFALSGLINGLALLQDLPVFTRMTLLRRYILNARCADARGYTSTQSRPPAMAYALVQRSGHRLNTPLTVSTVELADVINKRRRLREQAMKSRYRRSEVSLE